MFTDITVLCPLSLDSEGGHLWDLLALDGLQKRAECLRFCVGRSVTPTGQLPVSVDIEYEFSSRNPYNFLQVTYYKASGPERPDRDPVAPFRTPHSHPCRSAAGKVPESGVGSLHVLHGEPQPPGDEEQH